MKPDLKYKLLTFGCQMNEYDSEVIASAVESLGGIPVETEEDADVILFNTCCVRKKADNKVYGRLGRYKELKKENPDLIIVVTGCLAQKDGRQLLRRFPHVDIVLGTHNLQELVPLIQKAGGSSSVAMVDEEGAQFLSPAPRKSGLTGYIPISIGCDCYCTYCIVPYVRGRLKSRPLRQVVAEAEKLVKEGFKEIFLLGQNVNTYGFDLEDKPTFTMLLEEINRIEGVRRIRFTSPHPKDFSPELIKAVGRLENLCECVHLPLQSGSDRILKLMNRKYDRQRYREIVQALREEEPNLSFSTDIIAGFPGETAEDFEESLEFIREMQFDQAFMFAYSLRDGTAAATMPDQVPHDEKMERLNRLIAMQNDISRAKNEKKVGNVVECLVECVSKKDGTRVTGRTRSNRVVNFSGDESMVGSFVNVKLLEAYTWGWMGERIIDNGQ